MLIKMAVYPWQRWLKTHMYSTALYSMMKTKRTMISMRNSVNFHARWGKCFHLFIILCFWLPCPVNDLDVLRTLLQITVKILANLKFFWLERSSKKHCQQLEEKHPMVSDSPGNVIVHWMSPVLTKSREPVLCPCSSSELKTPAHCEGWFTQLIVGMLTLWHIVVKYSFVSNPIFMVFLGLHFDSILCIFYTCHVQYENLYRRCSCKKR